MVKKAIVTCLALFVLYSVFVITIKPWWWKAAQHQWQNNKVSAQNVFYADSAYSSIIVGSSMSERVHIDSAPGIYNLALSGLSIFDGLNVITRSNKYPKKVFVEINVITRDTNQDFSSSMFSPVLMPLRKYFVALRERNQPIAALGTRLYNHVSDWTDVHLKPAPKSKAAEVNRKSIYTTNLAMHKKEYNSIPDVTLLHNNFELLHQYLAQLEAHNVQVIFFEMPVDNQLQEMPMPKAVRKAFLQQFPKDKYRYIFLPDSVAFETVDGIHLTADGARQYSAYFKQNM